MKSKLGDDGIMILILGVVTFSVGAIFVGFPTKVDAMKRRINRHLPTLAHFDPEAMPTRTFGWLALAMSALTIYYYFLGR